MLAGIEEEVGVYRFRLRRRRHHERVQQAYQAYQVMAGVATLASQFTVQHINEQQQRRRHAGNTTSLAHTLEQASPSHWQKNGLGMYGNREINAAIA